jgi:ADP-ribose pyrophosphatase YjhB (NUDIX family)
MKPRDINDSWYKKPKGIPTSQSAGGIVIRFIRGKPYIALVREDIYADYVIPKGRINESEKIEEAAIREIEEETGLNKLNLICKLAVLNRLSFNKSVWKETHCFLFITNQESGIPTDKTRSYSKTEWFPLDSLPPMLWPDQEKLIKDNMNKIRKLTQSQPPKK